MESLAKLFMVFGLGFMAGAIVMYLISLAAIKSVLSSLSRRREHKTEEATPH